MWELMEVFITGCWISISEGKTQIRVGTSSFTVCPDENETPRVLPPAVLQ